MKRIVTALVLIAAVVALILFGQLWMITLATAVVAGLAAWEFRGIAAAMNSPIPLWWLIGATALFFAVTYRYPLDTIVVVSLAVVVLLAWNSFRTPLDRVLGETAAGLLSLLYIAYPLTLIPRLWAAEDGTGLVIFLCVCVWSGDIAALYIGKRFGKRKLAPALSPNKTVAGAVASVVASVAFGMGVVALGDWLQHSPLGFARLHLIAPWWQLVLLAVLLNAAAQLGDLLESALKRGAGIKDSGTLLPGHGGVLDRIDALLLAAPVLWYVLVIRDLFAPGAF